MVIYFFFKNKIVKVRNFSLIINFQYQTNQFLWFKDGVRQIFGLF